MSDQKLKSCPFCGQPVQLATMKYPTKFHPLITSDEKIYFMVMCDNPECEALGAPKLNKSDAIIAWNKRVKDGEK